MRVTWHPVDREVAETEKGSAQAEVLIILGVEGLAPCRHSTILSRQIKGRLFSRELPDCSVVGSEKTDVLWEKSSIHSRDVNRSEVLKNPVTIVSFW